jgi:hypothetical protein
MEEMKGKKEKSEESIIKSTDNVMILMRGISEMRRVFFEQVNIINLCFMFYTYSTFMNL